MDGAVGELDEGALVEGTLDGGVVVGILDGAAVGFPVEYNPRGSSATALKTQKPELSE